MLILLVEDELKVQEALAFVLKKQGYGVDTAGDGSVALEMAESGIYDLIILDRMLPSLDGLSLLRELRSQQLQTPVIFLTAKDTPQDRVEGLDAGADDYLVKPFTTEELLARLRALGRRKEKELQPQLLKSTGFTFDPLRNEVHIASKCIRLSVKESMLLQLLMYNKGQVLPKDRIVEKIWGYNAEIESANVDLYIHYLRKKIETDSIITIRGVGYCFRENSHV